MRFLTWALKEVDPVQGRVQDFKLGGRTLINCAERREARTFWGISCEKSRFFAKQSIFFQLRREARKYLGYFVWKIMILRQKIIFFPILGGGTPGAPLPWIRPCSMPTQAVNSIIMFVIVPKQNAFKFKNAPH